MTTDVVVMISKETVMCMIAMGAPMLIAGALIGVVVSMIQTVTQLKDQSLTFIPKIVGVLGITMFTTPFLIRTIVNYTERIFQLAIDWGTKL